jgi:tartrate dehydratase beta subunit/fumarate hydratase class I family protein
VAESCKKYGEFFLGTIEGAAEQNIKHIECLEYLELGM